MKRKTTDAPRAGQMLRVFSSGVAVRGKIGVTFDAMALMGGSGMLILRGSKYHLIQFERKQIARRGRLNTKLNW